MRRSLTVVIIRRHYRQNSVLIRVRNPLSGLKQCSLRVFPPLTASRPKIKPETATEVAWSTWETSSRTGYYLYFICLYMRQVGASLWHLVQPLPFFDTFWIYCFLLLCLLYFRVHEVNYTKAILKKILLCCIFL